MTEDPEFTPDVLAEFDQTTDADAELEWLMENAAALIEVARDHAHLTEEVRTLRLLVAVNEASQIPDGHTRIDGKLFRLERHGDLNRYGLVRVEANDD